MIIVLRLSRKKESDSGSMELSFDNDCSYSELVVIGMKRKRKLTKILAFLTVLWEYRLDLFHPFLASARVGTRTTTGEDLGLPAVFVAALERNSVASGKTHN